MEGVRPQKGFRLDYTDVLRAALRLHPNPIAGLHCLATYLTRPVLRVPMGFERVGYPDETIAKEEATAVAFVSCYLFELRRPVAAVQAAEEWLGLRPDDYASAAQ